MKSSPTAYNLLRQDIHYRRECFSAGLEAAGYRVKSHINKLPEKDDILVIWNRYGSFEEQAEKFEKAGARVLVIENGYLGHGYAISLSQHHHGKISGEKIIEQNPHQNDGHILICGQRGIGSKLMASPPQWAEKTAQSLKTNRRIVIRNHPAKQASPKPLDDDLAGAYACVVWSSCSGIRALQLGVPVIYAAPRWIAENSAIKLQNDLDIEKLPKLSHLIGLQDAARNQWDLEEIKSGKPFRELL